MNTTETKKRRLSELLEPEFMARLDGLDVFSRKILQGKLQGERRSKQHGQSVEFADHRPYVVGDDLRFIDWNIYGRLNQLFLKLFLEEQDLTVHLVMDLSGSMQTVNSVSESNNKTGKDRFIRKFAAAMGYISLINNNRLTISTFADGLQKQIANMRGRNYLPRMTELILNSECYGVSDFNTSCRQLAAGRIGKGIMIILSDFFFREGYDTGLRQLIGRNYDLYTIQVLSPEEISPSLKGDLKLVDVEDGDTAEITVSTALLKYYQRNLTAYCNELKDFCRKRGVNYILVNSADSVETLILSYLRKIHLLQ